MITRMVGFIRSRYEAMLMLLISIACLSYIFKFSDIWEVAVYWFNEVGPAMYLMLPMSVVLIWLIILLMLGRLDNGLRKELLWVEKYAPILGILGTVLGLLTSLSGFDFTQDTAMMMQVVISGLLKALSSTAYGLVLAIIAGNIYDRTRG